MFGLLPYILAQNSLNCWNLLALCANEVGNVSSGHRELQDGGWSPEEATMLIRRLELSAPLGRGEKEIEFSLQQTKI